MVGEYGTDDVDYLLKVTEKENCFTITSRKDGQKHFVSVGRFDNRSDKTTPFRKPQSEWLPEEVKAMKDGMQEAFDQLLMHKK